MLASVLFISACQTKQPEENMPLDADAIIKMMSANVDTTNFVIDNMGNKLSFRQYIPIIFNGDGMIYRDKENWRLQRFTALPFNIDTTNFVIDNMGNKLNFRQYIPIIFNGEGMIYRDMEKWRLQRFTTTGLDSLKHDDYAISRVYRWDGLRARNVVRTSEEKFKDISATFLMADRIVVYKSRRIMALQLKGKEILRFKINLGRNPVGDKIMENDNRTPEGVYHLDNKYERYDKYYKSFWISYPDSTDIAKAKKRNVKPGVGVMIHGTQPERVNAKDWTNGCIALSNKDMDTLFKYVIPGTVIEIRK